MLSVVIAITVACTKKSAADPLARQGDTYILTVPRIGRAQTSTLLNNAQVTFKNSSDGQVWGFSERMFRTGDGISIGGKIEFFVGTQKDYDAEQQKKNKSDGVFNAESFATA
jgi:hypothetical protein